MEKTYFDLANEIIVMMTEDIEKGNNIVSKNYIDKLKDDWDIPNLDKIVDMVIYIVVNMAESLIKSLVESGTIKVVKVEQNNEFVGMGV